MSGKVCGVAMLVCVYVPGSSAMGMGWCILVCGYGLERGVCACGVVGCGWGCV
jgi:hypothetical protein